MTAVLSLLVVLGLSVLITRVFTAALALTGVSKALARLQAVSAFTGVGFTTTESEHIVGHPVRRRLLIVLMVLGNAGFVTAASTLILSFVDVADTRQALLRGAAVAAGVLALVLLATSDWIDRRLHTFIEWALTRWSRLEAVDYVDLLDLSGDYRVRELLVEEQDWLAERRLDELRLHEEGVTVLGVHRGDRYLGVPRGETSVRAGDRLVLYGRADQIRELDERRPGTSGDESHREAVASQQRERARQEREDEVGEEETERRRDEETE